mgnify:CR=1 FL=1
MVSNLYASTIRYISGVVTDNRSNPLYGANVVLQNTFQGSTTDSLGFYKVRMSTNGSPILLEALQILPLSILSVYTAVPLEQAKTKDAV